ncbi:MAG: glycoside hydrolase family 127 protein [Oscillospiraceae bacterium]|nr:glycoside hydrolase family 127 protein [Oscillospiraceae bacterium]
MDQKLFSNPIDLKCVKITDRFWHAEQELVRKEVIPYQWDALNDRVPGAEPSYCMHNFRAAARKMREKKAKGASFAEPGYTYRGFQVLPENTAHPESDQFYGFVFQDTDFSKWIEAVAYSLTQHPDKALEATADEAIELVCAAQHESGYLDTYYIINGMDRALTNLRDHHELYCLGHLVEGAVAYYQATGKDKLLRVACRFADYAAERFGPEPEKRKGYPGHEIAEMALVRLYEVTGERKYLNLSKFFLDQRGTRPYYFDQEAQERSGHEGKPYAPDTSPLRYAYHQAHLPVREQSEAVGHAVRAGYLYSGMASAAKLTGDDEMYAACLRLWDSIVKEKLYITGGMGGTVYGEAFSYPFDLPNDSAYSETCAAIALVFFARQMLEIAPKAEYADVMERALYNTVLAGMALDGKSFFYVNPLEVVPDACRRDRRLGHVKPVRQKWFGCACCPPNIARLVSSVAAYAYTENEDTLWTHLYMGSTVAKKLGSQTIQLKMETELPWQGRSRMTMYTDSPVTCTLAFRIPGWCTQVSITAPQTVERTDQDGYCYLTGVWRDGDAVALDFPMEVHFAAADPRVQEDIGKVAIVRGPITYCVEEADNGGGLHLFRLDLSRRGEIQISTDSIQDFQVTTLHIPALQEAVSPTTVGLYREYTPPVQRKTSLKFIPYFAWANRGEGEMRVWLRVL